MRVGSCNHRAALRPRIAPTTPATSPHTVSGPTNGAASRLAGKAMSGSVPNVVRITGATPICAAVVTPSASRNQVGPRSQPAIVPAPITMPAHAPHESRNPTECSRNGSAIKRTMAASTRTRAASAGRPMARASITSAAMTAARSTDGSQRVIVPNNPTTAIPAAKRGPRRRRASAGSAMANANATLAPETASK